MTDVITIHDLNKEMVRLSGQLDGDNSELVRLSHEYARVENEYRLAKANAYLASSGTVDERKAHVDKATSVERVAAHTAEGLLFTLLRLTIL